jgi:hypothetical protein
VGSTHPEPAPNVARGSTLRQSPSNDPLGQETTSASCRSESLGGSCGPEGCRADARDRLAARGAPGAGGQWKRRRRSGGRRCSPGRRTTTRRARTGAREGYRPRQNGAGRALKTRELARWGSAAAGSDRNAPRSAGRVAGIGPDKHFPPASVGGRREASADAGHRRDERSAPGLRCAADRQWARATKGAGELQAGAPANTPDASGTIRARTGVPSARSLPAGPTLRTTLKPTHHPPRASLQLDLNRESHQGRHLPEDTLGPTSQNPRREIAGARLPKNFYINPC